MTRTTQNTSYNVASYTVLKKTVAWILKNFIPSEYMHLREYDPLIKTISATIQREGEVGFIAWAKPLRLALLHHLSGEWKTKKVGGVPLHTNGCPIELMTLLGQEPYKPMRLRVVLTLLYLGRSFNLTTSPDIGSIVNESTQKEDIIDDLRLHVRRFWIDLNYQKWKSKVPTSLHFKHFHLSTKAGPNGQALAYSMVDFNALLPEKELVADLKTVGGTTFAAHFELLELYASQLPIHVKHYGQSFLRRLTYFPDKEGKVRVVAILDYFSQSVLRPLHDYLFGVLRKIPQDCTFSQGSFVLKTQGWKKFHSIDLTAATDRFPISVISLVLIGQLPKWYVEAWSRIMVRYPFSFSEMGKPERAVSYTVGNPMGAYSSWNSFAVAHHYILYWCCKKLGMDWHTSKYCLLGDDILIGEDNLAELYLETLQRLGVEVSPMKTHSSAALYEFAKRLVLDGVEITPFPISSIKESCHRFYLMTNLLREEERKGWLIPNGIPNAIESFYSDVLGWNSKSSAKMRDRSFSCNILMDIIRGTILPGSGVNQIAAYNNIDVTLTDEEALKALGCLAQQCFEESLVTTSKSFGDIATDLTLAASNIGAFDSTCEVHRAQLPSAVPISNVYGSLMEKHMEMDSVDKIMISIADGSWPLTLRSLALPKTDDVFSERVTHTNSRVASIFSDKVLILLRGLTRTERQNDA